MKRRTFITFLTLIGAPFKSYCCSVPSSKNISIKDLEIDSEDFIETDKFLDVRYGKNNWKKDTSHSIYFEIHEKNETGKNKVGVGINQPIKENEYLQLELVLERFIPYAGNKLQHHNQYGKYIYSKIPHLITRENISNVFFRKSAIPYYKISTKDVLSMARVVAVYNTKNIDTNKTTSRTVGISNLIKYVQPHCGGTQLVDDK